MCFSFELIMRPVLGRYNNKNDVVFGSVVSGRPSEIEGVEAMVGLFINTVPKRIKYEEDIRFNKLLNKVKELGKPNPLTVHVYAHNVLAVKWYLGQGFVVIQSHESNTLKKEIEGLQELGQHDTVKEKELKYKRQQLKYLMIYPNYFVNKS